MFGWNRADNIEFSRRHMIAVRLVDAINFAAPKVIGGFKPILAGFKLMVREEEYASWQTPKKRFKLYIEPAGWPRGSVISCFLIPKDGWQELAEGEMKTLHLGNWHFHGIDVGGGMDYQLQPAVLTVTVRPLQ